jgi:hypothetical protein
MDTNGACAQARTSLSWHLHKNSSKDLASSGGAGSVERATQSEPRIAPHEFRRNLTPISSVQLSSVLLRQIRSESHGPTNSRSARGHPPSKTATRARRPEPRRSIDRNGSQLTRVKRRDRRRYKRLPVHSFPRQPPNSCRRNGI